MALAESQHHTSRGQKTARAGGEARVALHGQVPEAPLPQGGRPAPLSEVAGWQSRVLRRTLSSSFVHTHLILSRLSKCPRSCLSMSLSARLCAFRSWRNSWWKCRRSFPIPRCSGLWSSTSTFQFLVVEDQRSGLQCFSSGQSSTATPSTKKRISERIVEQIVAPVSSGGLHGSFSGHGSSSSHSPAGVEERADEPGERFFFFALFPPDKKVRSWLRT